MIPKLTTGNGFGGSLRYDTRQGQGMKPGLAKVLDVSGVEFDIDKNGNYVINTRQVSRDFRAQTMGYKGDREIRKPVYHWVLSYHPDDKVSEEQMIEDAKDFLKRIGFDDTQYVMTVHYDKAHHHLHIVTNVVNNQGKRIPTMGLIDKAHAAAAAITKERGYTWGEQTKKENIKKDKIHKPHDRAREVIEPMIREAIAASTSFYDLQSKLLEEYGIMCNYTVAKDGKRGRLSFCFEYEGQDHPFKASDVARDLSFGYVDKVLKENYRKAQEKTQAKATVKPEVKAKPQTQVKPRIQEVKPKVAQNKPVPEHKPVKQISIADSTWLAIQKNDEKKEFTTGHLLSLINRTPRDISSSFHLVPGDVEKTATGVRWRLKEDGYLDQKTGEIYQKHEPRYQNYGKSFVDFSLNEQGELVAKVEVDPENHYSKGVSGTYNFATQQNSIKGRKSFGIVSTTHAQAIKNGESEYDKLVKGVHDIKL